MPDVLDVKPNVKTGRYLTKEQRLAIASLVSSGQSQTIVAQQFGVSCMTVSRIMREVNSVAQTLPEWRDHQTKLSINAVNSGLTHDADPYKRADLGVKVLTGLGVYKSGDTNVTVNNVFLSSRADLPRDWQERMRLVDTSEPALDVDSTVIDTTTTQHD